MRKQGEYRYSSSPLGKRIDIYETSESEGDGDEEADQYSDSQQTPATQSEQSCRQQDMDKEERDEDRTVGERSKKTESVAALDDEGDEEEKKDAADAEGRMPSLCTFDVRDKKTTFQTSCYVRRDIVSSSS